MNLNMNSTLKSLLAAITTTMLIASPAFAHDDAAEHGDNGGHHFVPKARAPLTNPAANYSGKTPVDRGNGNFFNVGTYGAPNPDYEQWAQSPTWAVSLSERPYSYDQKDRFIETLDERIKHFEIAVWNYSKVTDLSKPEGKAHAEKAAADLNPRIEKARDAWSKAKSSGRSDWENAQVEAKRAFLDLQAFYYGMHKNVH